MAWVCVSKHEEELVFNFKPHRAGYYKESWEGDIVHDSYDRLCIDNLYEVVYIEEEGTFAFKSLDKVDNYEPFVNLFEVYVVGNKFDKE